MARVVALSIVAAMVTLSLSEAVACRVSHFRFPPRETLVDGAGRIALAEFVGVVQLGHGDVRYRFLRIETLRGDVASTFTVDCTVAPFFDCEREKFGAGDTDFHGHRDPASGELTGGRMEKATHHNSSQCFTCRRVSSTQRRNRSYSWRNRIDSSTAHHPRLASV